MGRGRHYSVGPDLGPNCVANVRLSADDKSYR